MAMAVAVAMTVTRRYAARSGHIVVVVVVAVMAVWIRADQQ